MELKLANRTLSINTDDCHPVKGGYIATASLLKLDLPDIPQRYHCAGWQSWSLTAWIDSKRTIPPQRPILLNPMQTDPFYAQEKKPHGSWYGMVELSAGEILFIGSLALDSHVMLADKTLCGWYEQGKGEWFISGGTETEVFAHYATLLEARLGRGRALPAPRVWCSWYSLYTEIHENLLLRVLEELEGLPFDVIQIDDGWQIAIGEWEANDKFPSGMAALADRIRASGRKAGLWLAPLLAVPAAPLARQHPDWFLQDETGQPISAGFNWSSPLYALDTTHPAVLDWLTALMKKVRHWGYDYIKLDFLYAGALPGKRSTEMPREAAYRQGLKVIREALGDAYFLTCGAPILPSLGLCDAMRVGPDVAGHWVSRRDDQLLTNYTTPGARNALRTTLNRLWLFPLVRPDPDVVYFCSRMNSLTADQKLLLQDVAEICGFKACSDLPAWWTPAERQALQAFLEQKSDITRIDRYAFQVDSRRVDFAPHITLPASPGIFESLLGSLLDWLTRNRTLMQTFDRMTRRGFIRRLEKNIPIN